MKLRRAYSAGSTLPVMQILENQRWEDLSHPPEPFGAAWNDSPALDAGTGHAVLPFHPRSFRDFMLYERHCIDASRGYARRFMPAAHRFTSLVEAVTRRPFPAFKPSPLWYRQPIYYFGNHLSFVPSGTTVSSPSYSRALDYELELGVVLGKPLFNATPDEALEAIAAFVVLNDFSARDVQRAEMASGFGPQKSKHFLSSMSDVVVTADELLDDVNALKASVCINGREVCATSTAGMHHSIGEALAHACVDELLHPGELFGTGTLPGGCGMENGHWLKPGDLLQLRIDRIGEIQHRIA
jgi:2-keto-4-pentenoate hydratase/2-oxohepta-3-ene-1,7-dioic acid hydratase in catechol pathway